MGLSITNALEWTYADGGGHTCTLVLKEPNDSNHPTDQIVFLNSFFFFLNSLEGNALVASICSLVVDLIDSKPVSSHILSLKTEVR